ncbi:hypothetical protein AAFC00_002772 [Neodothiora populina]|uniref:SPRY domain-containing protein n=1 Tax=Neodothiora populina TaxID=2781224 RepID=A0ABR3P868_9PEZI
MADAPPVPGADAPPEVNVTAASSMPSHLQAEQTHAPAVSSPLNPDMTKTARAKPPPREREQREKRETLKKRESTAAGGRGSTPTVPSKRKASEMLHTAPSPMRYQIPEPRLSDYEIPKPVDLTSHEPIPFLTPDGEVELKKPSDRAENKKGYRYTQAVADPYFRHKQFYRQSDAVPYGPRMSWEDTDRALHFDETGKIVTNEKGYRMARANVCAREGSLYYEVKIVRGVPADGVSNDASGPQPHIRMGWARRESPLDVHPGYDGYSYGITDLRFETMHRSRPGKFFTPKPKKGKSKTAKTENVPIELNDNIREGDIIGMEINLPALSLHQKVVSGIYNPAVDMGDGFPEDASQPAKIDHTADPYDIIRDRIPVPYKGNVYFETMDYVPTKAMEAYADRTVNLSALQAPGPGAPSTLRQTPNPNHVEPSLRTLPHSSIRVYKNGQLVGTAFENLLAFLPPASLPSKAAGAREGFDDGMLGYFPAIASFWGGIAEVNFGEQGFWMPPPHLKYVASTKSDGDTVMHDADSTAAAPESDRYFSNRTLRPIGERFSEQIAEDIVWDIIDEVDFFMQDGGYGGKAGAGAVGGAKRSSANASLKEEVD